MFRRSIFTPAVAAVTGAVVISMVSSALAVPSGPRVTIRIEGAKRTLLAPTQVRAPAAGWITKDGAPKGKCPADSAAGALNVATGGRWSGSWSSMYNEYLITKILGQTESGARAYWEIFVNNVPASTGACEIKLHRGERLLFGAMPLTGTNDALVLKAPRTTTAGASLKVTVDYVNSKGMAVPLAGASVTGGGATATTNVKGTATLRPKRVGKLTLRAHKRGYVRAAPRTVEVSS
jgi:hypothetical protein